MQVTHQKTAKPRIGRSRGDDPARAIAVREIQDKVDRQRKTRKPRAAQFCPLCMQRVRQKNLKKHIAEQCPKRE
jgi:hypothetical protein